VVEVELSGTVLGVASAGVVVGVGAGYGKGL